MGNCCTISEKKSASPAEKIKEKIWNKTENIISYCSEERTGENFFIFEKSLQGQIGQLACLFIQLFLMSLQERFNYSKWLEGNLYYKGDLISRKIKTVYGEVCFWRNYLIRKEKKSGGFYPLDAFIGLTRDGFSPLVMNLSTRLATRVSFSVSVLLFKYFYGWSPSSKTVKELVLGMGRDSSIYMEHAKAPEGDGEILVIEADGKATPTATEEELKKRRGKRKKNKSTCNCARHRSKHKRQCRCKKKRRKKGDKSKNGRSITLIAMYTLKRGEDGRLHGPINKKIWGSYAPRKIMFAWARRQATKRGFPPETNKRIHIVVDGEKCLYYGLSKLFPQASFALDIRHLEEKLWAVGRTFHKEGSEKLEQWVKEKQEFLYTRRAALLLTDLENIRKTLSRRAKRDKSKIEAVDNLIQYMQPRLNMMNYQKLIEEDLVIASGIIEGAARYVIGERMDCGGMRWIPERAEALLRLRCIELNGDWDNFFQWGYERWIDKMKRGDKVIIRKEKPDNLPDINFFTHSDFKNNESEELPNVA